MKTYKIFSIALICLSLAFNSYGQNSKTETIKVSGNCGMCKKKIETAAKSAGATTADWDVDKKSLTVKYSSKSTNNAKIQKAVAATGYDTQDFKATNAAYNKLNGCCKYERAGVGKTATGCCKGGSCSKDGKDDKCEKGDKADKSCCNKDAGQIKE